jgi:DNA polymerase I-like protein with 3'-5' exonuclease and polymerase domains
VILAATQREAGNFPIESTVADTMALALHECIKQRETAKLNFRVINQIHDALVLTVPEQEVDATIPLLSEAMHGIKIPVGRGRHAPMLDVLQLSVDVEICEHRWSEK